MNPLEQSNALAQALAWALQFYSSLTNTATTSVTDDAILTTAAKFYNYVYVPEDTNS